MIRLPLVNTFMKQLHPLNTITVDFKSNCQDETEVMKDENPSKSIAAFNVESTDVTNATFGFATESVLYKSQVTNLILSQIAGAISISSYSVSKNSDLVQHIHFHAL